MFNMKYIVLYPVFLLTIQAAEFPPYFTKCCGIEPNFNSCLVTNMQKALFPLIQGDAHYNLPSMLPYRFGKVVLLDDENGYYIHRNTLLHGFSSTKILSASVDWNAQTCNASYSMKVLDIRFAYDFRLNGSSEMLTGTGGTIMENVVMNHSFSFIMQSDGHVHIVDPILTYSVERVIYELENIDAATNQYLNDNFASLHVILKEKAGIHFSDILTWPYVSLAEAVALNDMSSCPCEKKRRKCEDETHSGEHHSESGEHHSESGENHSESRENHSESGENHSDSCDLLN